MTSIATRSGTRTGGTRHEAARTIPLLLAAAVVLWGVMSGLGWLLAHPLHDTGFERWDGSVDRWFAAHRHQPWTSITHILTFGAETPTVIGVGLVFFVGMRLYLHRWRESLFLFTAVVGEVTIFVCTTLVINRHRPAVPHLDTAPPTSSFPSGHTAASVALYGALALVAVTASNRVWLRRIAVALAVLVPVCVATARMYRGMHYPTDVMGGALLAVLWLTVASTLVLRPGSRPARRAL